MSAAHLVVVRNPFHPAQDREMRPVPAGSTLDALAPKLSAAPFIVLLNGEAVLRAGWSQTVAAEDVVTVVFLPRGGGGGGSNPLKIVLSIALSIYATPLAAGLDFTAGLAGEMYLAGMSATLTGATALATSVVAAGISLAGNMLINAAMGTPKAPSSMQAAALASPSPTYNLQAQGNAARLEQAIPVQYGRLCIYPDFAAMPYAEYSGNEQYLYELLVLGAGQYDIEAIRIDDTNITSFAEIESEVVAPGGQVTLFPAEVVTSSEVSGQEAIYNTTLGPFVVNAAGTQINNIAIDVVAPRGLYYANDAGGLNPKSISWNVEAREIDDLGDPVGVFTSIGTDVMSGATTTPQRKSSRFPVPSGRYEVKLTRTSAKDESSRAGHDLNWVGLRGYLPGTRTYGDITLLALRMRATNNLSNTAARKINVICTRKLPIWNGSSFSAPTPTSSIAWALADICTNATWGAGLAQPRVDLAGLLALDATWTANGDTFNGRFDNTISFWEALTKIARAGRTYPYMQGGVIRFSRDQAQSVPVALYSMRNIVRGSFAVQYVTPHEAMADAVDVSYFDETVWKPRRVLAQMSGSTADKPAKIDMFGVTNRSQAWREGLYEAACNRHRRKIIKFATDMEGFIPSFGDLIAIAHDMPQWGQTAEATAWDVGTLTLTVNEPLTWGTGTHYVGLRKRNGGVDGPIAVTQGADEYTLVLGSAPSFTPYTGGDEERTHIAFGLGETWRQRARVLAVKPRGLEQVEIECINEEDAVHSVSGVPAAPAESWSLPTLPTRPTIPGDVDVVSDGNPLSPVVSISWPPAPGATSYQVEQSFDALTWQHVGTTTSAQFNFTTRPGAQSFRVAPQGLTLGDWATWSGTIVGAAVASETPLQLTGLTSAVFQTTIDIGWPAHGQAGIQIIEVWRNDVDNSATASRIAVLQGDQLEYSDTTGTSSATFYYWIRAVNLRGVAGPMSASTSQTTTEVGGAGGVEVVDTLPTTGNFEGRIVYLTTDDKLYRHDGTNWTSAVAAADLSGQIGSSQIATNAVTADKILAGAVTAAKMSVSDLSSINANLGSITGGSLNIGGKFVVDSSGNATIKSAATGARVEIYNNVIKVYDASNVLRVKLGDLSA